MVRCRFLLNKPIIFITRATLAAINRTSSSFDQPPQRQIPNPVPLTMPPQPVTDRRINVQWYYGPMSRDQAEQVLDKQPVGTFLLRDCQSKAGCFTLTYK